MVKVKRFHEQNICMYYKKGGDMHFLFLLQKDMPFFFAPLHMMVYNEQRKYVLYTTHVGKFNNYYNTFL